MRDRSDPGEAWASELLAPLRRMSAEVDVAPAVMDRLAAAATGTRPLPAFFSRPKLLWAGSVAVSTAALAALVIALTEATLSGGGAEARTAATAFRGLAGRLGEMGLLLAGRLAAATVPILRAAWTIIEAASPIIRGAGLVAALGGFLSIMISLYVFARARAGAPLAAGPGSPLIHGGPQ